MGAVAHTVDVWKHLFWFTLFSDIRRVSLILQVGLNH